VTIRRLAPLLALIATPALAQPLSCSLPDSAPAPAPAAPDGPSRSMPIVQYTLALSWAPDFCATHADADGECRGKSARFGFVLHGLWPDGAAGTWPQWCAPKAPATTQVPAEVVRRMACTTPSPSLVAHEWAKHGTCMAPDPQAYFTQSSAMFHALHFPDMAALAHRPGLTAGQLRDAFVAANPRYPRESIGVMTGDALSLQEVHLCHDSAMRPTTCQMRGAADSAKLRITPF
jgi:ribonuclease T2